MYVSIARGGCVGCAGCVGLCPEVFHLNDDGTAIAITTEVPEEYRALVEKAVRICPVDVIFIDDE